MSSFRVKYQTIEFGTTDIHVRSLRDSQEFSDDDDIAKDLGISSALWPIFGTVWESGKVLAELMHEYEIEGKRILEVGCGLGLSSLVLNERLADITATDIHPEAGAFLEKNVELNGGASIPFVRTGWADELSQLGKFDLIIGSDLLYEQEHAELLSLFIDQHCAEKGEVIVVDPGRNHRAKFTKKMLALGFQHNELEPVNAYEGRGAEKRRISRFVRR